MNLSFKSKEKGQNIPELVIDTTPVIISTASLYVENLDKFPSNEDFVFSRLQVPWSRDTLHYNANHDSLKVRIHNKGINPLVISSLQLSDTSTWKIEKINNFSSRKFRVLIYSKRAKFSRYELSIYR